MTDNFIHMHIQNNSSTGYVISPTKAAVLIGIIIFLLIIIVPSYLFFQNYQKAQKQFQQITLNPQEEARTILENVRKLTDLPVDEVPAIVTILDKERAKNQPFFTKAKNGDKIIIFNKNKIAILYDPLNNRIIERGPLIVPSITPGS